MGKNTFKIFTVCGTLVITAILSGCVVVINNDKPSPDEQSLVDIQSSASQEIDQVNQKIQTGNYSTAQIQQLVNQAKQTMDQDLQKIQKLNLPQRAQALEEQTKQYLVTADQTYQSFLQMAQQGNAQVQQLVNNLTLMSQPLLNMAQQLSDSETSFLKQFQSYASQQ